MSYHAPIQDTNSSDEPKPSWRQQYDDTIHPRGQHYPSYPFPSRSDYPLRDGESPKVTPELVDSFAITHDKNDGTHVSPSDSGVAWVGVDGLIVQLVQGIDEKAFKSALARATLATTGIAPNDIVHDEDDDILRGGGLQHALESQTIIFEVFGASRALTHQLVRSRRAGFHQQSQRATWYGNRPDVRVPEPVFNNPGVRETWMDAIRASWDAYNAACDAGIAYENARYILPEGTVNYILCEYNVREFMNFFAYRGCSMFLAEMVIVARKMRQLLVKAHPFLEPHVKISCETGALCWSCGGDGKWRETNQAHRTDPLVSWVSGITAGSDCPVCDGTGSPGRKCTFRGWENVDSCVFPWGKQDNRVFLPSPKFRI